MKAMRGSVRGSGSMRRRRRGVSTRCVSALALALVLAWVFMVTHLLSTEPTPAPRRSSRTRTRGGRTTRRNTTKPPPQEADARPPQPRQTS